MDLASLLALISGGAAALLAKFPLLGTIFMVMGVLRAILKPLMSFIRAVTAATPSKSDDQIADAVESSAVFKWLSYALDYIASIKVGAQANPEKAK